MREVSNFRLYLLRATYLLIAVGLGATIWPGILRHTPDWTLMRGVVHAMLGAVSLLALLGLRYPLQMLPLLMFELAWKALWLVAFALPIWTAGRMDPRTWSSVTDCLMGIVILPIAIPWPWVWDRYVKQRGDRWR